MKCKDTLFFYNKSLLSNLKKAGQIKFLYFSSEYFEKIFIRLRIIEKFCVSLQTCVIYTYLL